MSLLLFAALLSASPAVHAAPAQTGIPAAPAAPKPAKPKLICHVSEIDTGTRMAKRTCLTQDEWDSRVQGRSVDEMQTLPTQH